MEKLDLKLKVLIEKRYCTSTHIERAMEMFDVLRRNKVIAETEADMKIMQNVFEITKSIIKQMAEDFQLIDRDMNNLIEEIQEFNKPEKPNPLLGWHEVEDSPRSESPEIVPVKSASKISRAFTKNLLKSLKPPKKRQTRTSPISPKKTVRILKTSPYKSKTLSRAITKKVMFKGVRSKAKKGKMINDAIIQRAIHETE